MARFLQENYSCIYSEGSDQNFDEETKGIGESRRGCSQKRLKSYKVVRDAGNAVMEGLVSTFLVVLCHYSILIECVLDRITWLIGGSIGDGRMPKSRRPYCKQQT